MQLNQQILHKPMEHNPNDKSENFIRPATYGMLFKSKEYKKPNSESDEISSAE